VYGNKQSAVEIPPRFAYRLIVMGQGALLLVGAIGVKPLKCLDTIKKALAFVFHAVRRSSALAQEELAALPIIPIISILQIGCRG